MQSTTTDNGYRSACCYAPIKLGRRKIKTTNLKVKIWICCQCGKRDVNIIEYTKARGPVSTSFLPDDVDKEDEVMLESDAETA